MAGVSFDRAASFYDATRGLPDDVRLSLARILATELSSRGTCLEIGVGTGRIALPLSDLGIPMVGTDISAAMLDRLVANASSQAGVADDPSGDAGHEPGGPGQTGHPPASKGPSGTGRHGPPFPVIRADATELPLVAGSFGAVMASHVLHLIPAWRVAVDEAIRVLRPGGVLLVDFGGHTPAPWRTESLAVLAAHGVQPIRPGVTAPGPLAEYLGSRATVRQLPAVEMTVSRSLGQEIDEWEHQILAWTWPYDAGQMRAACNAVRDWAAKEGWSTDAEVDVTSTIVWWAFDLTDGAD